ncbi:MAG: hypothetical protein ACFE8N_11385, partial [Promethearchaeota archaeon]
MAENQNNSEEIEIEMDKEEAEDRIVKKDFIPHFFPTYRIKRVLYPLPILILVTVAGVLAY